MTSPKAVRCNKRFFVQLFSSGCLSAVLVNTSAHSLTMVLLTFLKKKTTNLHVVLEDVLPCLAIHS